MLIKNMYEITYKCTVSKFDRIKLIINRMPFAIIKSVIKVNTCF